MSTITLPFPNFQTDAPIVASQHNSNNSTIVNDYNGNVTDANISASAAIAGTKVSPNFGSQNVVTTGNIGAGTASPVQALDVNGSAYIRGNNPLILNGSGFEINSDGTNLNLTSSNAILLTTTGDVYTNAWADYSASSTIVGWASFTTKQIYTKKIGKTVFVNFYLAGTSNATTITFTVPYTTPNVSNQFFVNLCTSEDNGVLSSTPGIVFTLSNSSTIDVFKDITSSNPWTNSGTKIVQGQLWYQSV